MTRMEQAQQVAERVQKAYGCVARATKYAELTVVEIENVDPAHVPPSLVDGFLIWRKAL